MTISGDTADAEPTQPVTAATGATAGAVAVGSQTKVGTLLAGSFRSGTSATYSSISPVWVFLLPSLAADQTVVGADLRLNFARVLTPAYNADLYGLPARTAATVLAADYYNGTLDTNATLIQDNFGNSATSTTASNVTTSATGEAALLAYINDQYASGGAGQFVFLRLSADYTTFPIEPATGSTGYRALAKDNAATTAEPQLILNVVPEPSTAGLLLMGVAGGLLRRRRRRRAVRWIRREV